ncbi:M20/M25/M40 family metallo-hydrolase [Pedobacter sp. CG_S7]|uniref:M28 family metallopeptidase n=1 Tax=Pedobacter sp. CG_S7 TaxID=3143930 RepID=UPI0033912903
MLSGIANTTFSQQTVYARKVIQTLASPAFKGRGYVESGDHKASAYIAGEFKKFGLLPLNKDSYFQEFNLPVNTFPGKVELKLNGGLLTTAVDYLVSASSPPIHGTYKVISVNRTDINNVTKLAEILVRSVDAFILIDNRALKEELPEVKQFIDGQINELIKNETFNFKGLLIYSSDKLTWTTLSYQTKRPVIKINKKDLDPTKVNSLSIAVDVKFIPAYTTRNVAGLVKGSSGIDSTLVITAHYDHLGLLGKKVYFPGANDNASGVAMLLSFARHYAQHPPKYNMVFLAFSGEEIGLLGSAAFVKKPLIALDKIKFLVNFDLAGTGEEGVKVVNATKYKVQFDKLVQLNQQNQLLKKVDSRGEACNSDHCRFYQQGVPSFFIYTQGGIQAYHDIYDRAETLPLTAFDNYFELLSQFFDCGVS